MVLVRLVVLVVTVVAAAAETSEGDSVKVELTQGVVEGVVLAAGKHTSRFYYSFRGIPYAQPPVGTLRFKVNTFMINFKRVRT